MLGFRDLDHFARKSECRRRRAAVRAEHSERRQCAGSGYLPAAPIDPPIGSVPAVPDRSDGQNGHPVRGQFVRRCCLAINCSTAVGAFRAPIRKVAGRLGGLHVDFTVRDGPGAVL